MIIEGLSYKEVFPVPEAEKIRGQMIRRLTVRPAILPEPDMGSATQGDVGGGNEHGEVIPIAWRRRSNPRALLSAQFQPFPFETQSPAEVLEVDDAKDTEAFRLADG